MRHLLAADVQAGDDTMRAHLLQSVPRKRPVAEERVHPLQDVDLLVQFCQLAGQLHGLVDDREEAPGCHGKAGVGVQRAHGQARGGEEAKGRVKEWQDPRDIQQRSGVQGHEGVNQHRSKPP